MEKVQTYLGAFGHDLMKGTHLYTTLRPGQGGIGNVMCLKLLWAYVPPLFHTLGSNVVQTDF